MANVWFVERVGRDWKRLGDQPAFQRPLCDLIFKLDLGPQRRQGEVPEPGSGPRAEATGHTKVYVEVTADDLRDAYFGGYFPGWYDSPYSGLEAARRLR